MSTTQIISSPLQTAVPTSPQAPNLPSSAGSFFQATNYETECKKICVERFKYVLLFSAAIQYLLLIIFAIPLDLRFLNPYRWFTELFAILCSPLSLFNVIYGILSLNVLLKEKAYYGTRMYKFIMRFSHESFTLFLNIFIGLFTSRLFVRYLGDDYKEATVEQEGKSVLNGFYSYLMLNGIFMRCYFYFKCHDDENCLNISFSMVHQSKFSQIKRETIEVIKSSLVRSLMPTFHFVGFYILFGNTFNAFLQKISLIEVNDQQSFWNGLILSLNIRLFVYSWILGSLILCNMELLKKIINIFATQPKQFAISSKNDEITLTKALEIKRFQITRHLAAQDLAILSDSANDTRRKEFYELSIPGAHPHNFKNLVKQVLGIIDEFNNEMKTNLEYVAKNRNNNVNSTNDAVKNFYEHKRIIREKNEMHGIRRFNSSPIILQHDDENAEKNSKLLMKVKEKLLSNQIIGYLFGEPECGKLNFLLSQNSQVLIWLIEGISSIIARSLKEDNYGIVQHDIKPILKALLKLKSTLDQVGAINTIVKNRNFVALRSALRRSLYRIVIKFSQFFEDMLLDPEDIKTLHTFVTFKEM